mmetsp:Transcript_38122/g.96404  ORF Transcript_38122/g.96404 Transcript_38122/m.96404 type:complete len:435 (-) Transcript_38122:2568-3872(-)
MACSGGRSNSGADTSADRLQDAPLLASHLRAATRPHAAHPRGQQAAAAGRRTLQGAAARAAGAHAHAARRHGAHVPVVGPDRVQLHHDARLAAHVLHPLHQQAGQQGAVRVEGGAGAGAAELAQGAARAPAHAARHRLAAVHRAHALRVLAPRPQLPRPHGGHHAALVRARAGRVRARVPAARAARAQAAAAEPAGNHPAQAGAGGGTLRRLPHLVHRARVWRRVRGVQRDGVVHRPHHRRLHLAGRTGGAAGEAVAAHGAGAVLRVARARVLLALPAGVGRGARCARARAPRRAAVLARRGRHHALLQRRLRRAPRRVQVQVPQRARLCVWRQRRARGPHPAPALQPRPHRVRVALAALLLRPQAGITGPLQPQRPVQPQLQRAAGRGARTQPRRAAQPQLQPPGRTWAPHGPCSVHVRRADERWQAQQQGAG